MTVHTHQFRLGEIIDFPKSRDWDSILELSRHVACFWASDANAGAVWPMWVSGRAIVVDEKQGPSAIVHQSGRYFLLRPKP